MGSVPRWRREFRRAGFYVDAAGGGRHRFAARVLERQPRLDHPEPPPRPGETRHGVRQAVGRVRTNFLGAHAGVYSPLVFRRGAGRHRLGLAARRAGGCGCRGGAQTEAYPEIAPALDPDAEKARFLLAFGLPLLAMYTLLAFKTAGEPNWTAPGVCQPECAGRCACGTSAPVRAARRRCIAVAALGDRRCSSAAGDRHRPRPAGRASPGPTTATPPRGSSAGAPRRGRSPCLPPRGGTRPGRTRFPDRQPLPTRRRTQFLPAAPTPPRHRGSPVFLPESQSMETQFSFWPGYDQVTVEPTPPQDGETTPSRHGGGRSSATWASVPFIGHSALFITDDERHRNLPDSRRARLSKSVRSSRSTKSSGAACPCGTCASTPASTTGGWTCSGPRRDLRRRKTVQPPSRCVLPVSAPLLCP